MDYIAHKTGDGKTQTVAEHLQAVADMAAEFALEEYKSLAYAAGIAHDLGKYTDSFQRRIRGEQLMTEHSIQGAMEYRNILNSKNIGLPLLEYCIAGHHTGLPNGGASNDLEDSGTLQGRLRHQSEDYSSYKNDLKLPEPDLNGLMKEMKCILSEYDASEQKRKAVEWYAFCTRYVYSCLTDADFLDTEKFCNPSVERGGKGDFVKALECLKRKMEGFSADTPVRKARNDLQKQAYSEMAQKANLYLLNMPTGSGKTLCSIRIALEKAIKQNKKRIIYVIPYTSIIEQTAEIFESIFGDQVEILQHHSNYSYETEGEMDSTSEKLRRACENWDAKVIVTTSVQFFESLYHYKGSKLRKLHNLADAVIVFDEIHLIPLHCLEPCLQGIDYITRCLHSEAIFLSATMPDYLELLKQFGIHSKVGDLIPDKSSFGMFHNCSYHNMGQTDYDMLALRSGEETSSLIIVNKRKSAKELYAKLSGKKYHLSTYMCPAHRSEVIQNIRKDLKIGKQVQVVSTSLVEAGVDLDFQCVFRQLAGLDSILQAGGRCNREGLKKDAEVLVFKLNERQQRDIDLRANITASLMNEYDNIASSECINEYYKRLVGCCIGEEKRKGIFDLNNSGLDGIAFRTYAEEFEYIKSETVGIVIGYDDTAKQLIEQLKFGGKKLGRKLQKYTVSVYKYELDKLLEQGVLVNYDGILVLENPDWYDPETGLQIEKEQGDCYFG